LTGRRPSDFLADCKKKKEKVKRELLSAKPIRGAKIHLSPGRNKKGGRKKRGGSVESTDGEVYCHLPERRGISCGCECCRKKGRGERQVVLRNSFPTITSSVPRGQKKKRGGGKKKKKRGDHFAPMAIDSSSIPDSLQR